MYHIAKRSLGDSDLDLSVHVTPFWVKCGEPLCNIRQDCLSFFVRLKKEFLVA